MAITQCSECGGKVSTRATVCPHCGCPVEPQITCPDCGEELAASLVACPVCGGPRAVPETPEKPSEPPAPVAAPLPVAASDSTRLERSAPVIESVDIHQAELMRATQEPDFFTLYTSLKGRISRKTYWQKFFVPFAVAGFLAGVLDVVSGNWDFESAVGPLFVIVSLLLIWPGTVGVVKRLHDRDMTGWHAGRLWGAGALLTLLFVLGAGIDSGGSGGTASLETDDEIASYGFGLDIGRSLEPTVNHLDRPALIRGIQDALDGRDPAILPEQLSEVTQRVGTLIREEQNAEPESMTESNRVEGEAYLASNTDVEKDGLLWVILIAFIPLTLTLYGIYLAIVVGFLRGTEGPNRYGPDPLRGSAK